MADRTYSILLSHLHNPTPRLALATIQSALAHQLATTTPTPTPLAAIAVSSPLYLSQPFTHEKLQSLSTAFRHAAHLKYRELISASEAKSTLRVLLERSMHAVLAEWVDQVLQGVQGGHAVLRLAACGGLLLGIEDLRIGDRAEKKEGIDIGSARGPVEDETIVALAEVMDTYAHVSVSGSSAISGVEEWEREFQPAGQDVLSLALILASQTLPLAPQHKLKALPLPFLAKLLTSTVSSAFKHGTFLSAVSASVTLTPDQLVHISKTSSVAQALQSMASSPLTHSIPSISRFTASILALLIESPRSRLDEALFSIHDTLSQLSSMARQIERDWISCPLADCLESGIAEDSQDITKQIWTTLKTFLFTNIMLSESVLSNIVFLPPSSSPSAGSAPALLATRTLDTLSHLSFVISEFGGVTTTTRGFEQLKKTFYLALDVLASQERGEGHVTTQKHRAEVYVQQLCFELNSQRSETAAKRPRRAKQAFVLASIEQLVPVLSDRCIRDWVWGICYPHLYDASHRETYESAHSVVLTIFGVYAQRQRHGQGQGQSGALTPSSNSSSSPSDPDPSPPRALLPRPRTTWTDAPRLVLFRKLGLGGAQRPANTKDMVDLDMDRKEEEEGRKFVERMIPFYAQCLIENSTEDKLSIPQLCLAYSALVRSASAGVDVDMGGRPSGEKEEQEERLALAWYCTQLLLDTLRSLSMTATADKERHYKLCLALIACVSSLPFGLMLRALDEVEGLVMLYPLVSPNLDSDSNRKEETEDTILASLDDKLRTRTRRPLLEALFEEIMERVGDREKEAAVRWWYERRSGLLGAESGGGGGGDEDKVLFGGKSRGGREEGGGDAQCSGGDGVTAPERSTTTPSAAPQVQRPDAGDQAVTQDGVVLSRL